MDRDSSGKGKGTTLKVIGLDNHEYSWNPIGNKNISRETSSYHEQARFLLKSLFPSEKILEEVDLPGTKPLLFADFIVPLRKLIIEVHGEQHYKFVPFYHLTKKEFFKGRQRDQKKKEWCQLNNFYYIELPYWEKIDEWRERIINFGNRVGAD